MTPKQPNRRSFLQHGATLAMATGATANLTSPTSHAADPAKPDSAQQTPAATEFKSTWERANDRVWLGRNYWANPLQDWRITNGRVECDNAAPDRNVHVLTRQLGEHKGSFRMSVRLGRVDGAAISTGKGSAGFRIGIMGPLREYRNSLIFGKGIDAGISGEGALFIGDVRLAKPGAVSLNTKAVELRLTAEPSDNDYSLTLVVLDENGKELGSVSKNLPAEQLVGNVALVCNFGIAPGAGGAGKKKVADGGYAPGLGKFWFADWNISGSKIEENADRAFGPILFSQYTLHQGTLKLTAQMPPLGVDDSQTVRLQIEDGANWKTIGEEKIHPEARTATFRIEKWNDKKDTLYRLEYTLTGKNGQTAEHFWDGIVQRDPVDQPTLTVGDVSCNTHAAFPNHSFVANMAKLNPDLLAFVGDQFYEGSGGYGIVRAPLEKSTNDYLRKWYLHGWTWRDLTRDRPSLSLPDDHDVYQGNIWGENGAARTTTQEAGGYDMPAEWVNVVYRTQTAHHPDPYDSAPGKRGTMNWYGPLTYGRVSFAVLADRQYKSGPEGKVPKTDTGRGDHVKDPNFDPKMSDLPGLELLGPKQEQFLQEWVVDWRGADMKAVISQTIFTAMATTHGGDRMVLRADYDANGWPQTPRNRAVRTIRKAFAFHLAGDQHLPAVVKYGVDEHGDGVVAFAGPAVNVGYPRWWEPDVAAWTRPTEGKATGDFRDNFGNPLTVIAFKNGSKQPRQGDVLQLLDDKASGLGIVRFHKLNRTITVECWPLLADPTQTGTQFPGWPVTIKQLENYARQPAAQLPMLQIAGVQNPVVQVFEEASGELVYSIRLAGQMFQPHVFALGKYTIKISEPETGKAKQLTGVEAKVENDAMLEIDV